MFFFNKRHYGESDEKIVSQKLQIYWTPTVHEWSWLCPYHVQRLCFVYGLEIKYGCHSKTKK